MIVWVCVENFLELHKNLVHPNALIRMPKYFYQENIEKKIIKKIYFLVYAWAHFRTLQANQFDDVFPVYAWTHLGNTTSKTF